MRIAFAHNLQLTSGEDEAEFDTPTTVEAIAASLRRLGHDVDLVEVSAPVSEIVTRLESTRPDLVFNTAEGRHGRAREAFYPALFDQLRLPYTGSDAYVCTVTLDKRLTNLVVAGAGVTVPRGWLVDASARALPDDLPYPLFVKPNFEGSSKGITEDSVVTNRAQLDAQVNELLERYPGGVLVEAFIEGEDIVVPFLEAGSPRTGGVLSSVQYRISSSVERQHTIYDYRLKHELSDAVDVDVPALVPAEAAATLQRWTQRVVHTLGIRDLGRLDFRVGADGRVTFIEANALPSLEPGAGIYAAAALAGLADMDAVLDTVIRSACARHGIDPRARSRRRVRRPLKVGLAYNLKRQRPSLDGAHDHEAEYDSPETIRAVEEAIASFGHEVVRVEAIPEMLGRIAGLGIDLVFNIAEGLRGRSREALVPAVLDLLDIPYTGSDSATLSLTLDKALAKQIVRQAGVHTPGFLVMQSSKERLPRDLIYPLLVKPIAEGSSKGVIENSVVHDETTLRRSAKDQLEKYRQPVIVESFLPGREFTVGVLGDTRRPRVLPPMEIVFLNTDDPTPIYAFSHKQEMSSHVRYEAPALLDPKLSKEIYRAARVTFKALDCRDVARIDFRLDAEGRPSFIECNPLPGLTPGWSDLCLICDAAGISYRSLIGAILSPALRRLKSQRRIRLPAGGGSPP
jgi:D-alanine-D-alanine ligase